MLEGEEDDFLCLDLGLGGDEDMIVSEAEGRKYLARSKLSIEALPEVLLLAPKPNFVAESTSELKL